MKDLSGVMRSFGQEYTLFELEEVIKQIGAGKKEGAIQFSGTSFNPRLAYRDAEPDYKSSPE